MFKGIILILSACLVWALIYVLPTFLTKFSFIEIALARYFFFGIISSLFFALSFRKFVQLPREIWMTAFWFALIVNISYYALIVFAIHHSGAALTTLIAGIAPITIAFYGNLKQHEGHLTKLILPAILVPIGLFTVNMESLFFNSTSLFSLEYWMGVICAFLGLIFWTWYAVANNKFLKEHPTLTHFEWSTLLGIATFFWVILLIAFLSFFLDNSRLERYLDFNEDVQLFIVLTAILGCVCSWLGTFLWNNGSTRLPMSLGGQLTIFETIFGLTLVYLVEKRFPTALEGLGISMMFLAILYSMNAFKAEAEETHTIEP